MKRVGYLWVLIAFCLFTTRPALAWWTMLYPDAALEVTVDEPDTENEESKQPEETRQPMSGKQNRQKPQAQNANGNAQKPQAQNGKENAQEERTSGENEKNCEFKIKWKLAEWLGKWF